MQPSMQDAGEFGAEATEFHGRMEHHGAAGLFDTGQHRVNIEWHQRAQIENLGIDAFLG